MILLISIQFLYFGLKINYLLLSQTVWHFLIILIEGNEGEVGNVLSFIMIKNSAV